MSSLKFLVPALAAATVGMALAQGTPPRPATDPAVGAGQRSTQNVPMGQTGTPGGGGAAAQGSTAGSAAGMAAGTGAATGAGAATGSGSTAGATTGSSGGGAMASSGTGGSAKKVKVAKRAKADRN